MPRGRAVRRRRPRPADEWHAPRLTRALTTPPRNSRVANRVAPSTSAGSRSTSRSPTSSADRDHRAPPVVDVDAPAARRAAIAARRSSASSPMPGRHLGSSNIVADRAGVAPQERRTRRGSSTMNRSRRGRRPRRTRAASGARARGAHAAPRLRRRPRARAPGTPTPCRGSSCRTCRRRGRCGGRCRARSPRRSRARRRPPGPRRGSPRGWPAFVRLAAAAGDARARGHAATARGARRHRQRGGRRAARARRPPCAPWPSATR